MLKNSHANINSFFVPTKDIIDGREMVWNYLSPFSSKTTESNLSSFMWGGEVKLPFSPE